MGLKLRRTRITYPLNLVATYNCQHLLGHVAARITARASQELNMLALNPDCKYGAVMIGGLHDLINSKLRATLESKPDLAYGFGAGRAVYVHDHAFVADGDETPCLKVLIGVAMSVGGESVWYYTIIGWDAEQRQWLSGNTVAEPAGPTNLPAVIVTESDEGRWVPTMTEVAQALLKPEE